jgi:CelD/BcsL family acetyltransferase involved in cellulose biosynthesis
MRLLILMIEDRPAACLIEFPSADGPLLYNSGFDPAFKQYSAGAVTFGLGIQNAISERHKVFDMLRGQHGYKYQLGAKDRPLYRLSLHPR